MLCKWFEVLKSISRKIVKICFEIKEHDGKSFKCKLQKILGKC